MVDADWLEDFDSKNVDENKKRFEKTKLELFLDILLPFVLTFLIFFDIWFLYCVDNAVLPLLVGIFQILFLVIYFPSVNIVFKHLMVAIGRRK